MHESCILKINGKFTLFVFGGKIGDFKSDCKFSNTVFSLDLTIFLLPELDKKIKTEKKWIEQSSMTTARASFSHIVIEDIIYVFGGMSGN